MAIIVETGAAIAAAVSYISAADCTTYHTARGNALWTGTDAVKEAALIKAAMYLDGHYRGRWKGYQVYPATQAMEWPRYGVAPLLASDVIPQRLKDAQCELALRSLAGSLSADGDVSVKRSKVDVLETEYAGGIVPGQIAYPVVDQLVSDFVRPIGSADVLRG